MKKKKSKKTRKSILADLPIQEIIKKMQKKSYEEVAKEYNTSRGTIWRIMREHKALKYKNGTIEDFKSVYTSLWACARPMGHYKGKYPKGYLNRLANFVDLESATILHLFSGSLGNENKKSITLDINPNVKPDIVADATKKIPLPDESVDIVDVDPPYDSDFKQYGKKLYGTNHVKPYSFVPEAVRVLKKGGYLCILHQLVYITPEGCERKGVIAVTTGANMRVRILNIFRKKTGKELKK